MDEAARERELRVGAGQRRRDVLVGERDGHGEPRRIARPERVQLVEEEGVAGGADAEEHVTVPGGEVPGLAGQREDRHHPGNTASAGDAEDVLAHVGMKRGVAQRGDQAQAGAVDAIAEQPIERRIDVQLDSHHVVRQAAARAHDAAEGARRGHARLTRLQHPADLERAVGASHALAHEELGLALEIAAARSLRPLALGPATHEPGLAGTARAGGAFVGKLGAAPESGEENLLPGLALEVARPVPGIDDDLHAIAPPGRGQ